MHLLISGFFFMIPCFLFCSPLKVLHLTFHRGCANEIEIVAQKLSLDLTTWYIHDLPAYFFDESSTGCCLYNIGHARAERIWSKHRSYFESFDLIITSDTAPLSRIFLQNNWTKPLIIWMCNRFDYHDAASLDCVFPDEEYYQLFSQATQQSNVAIVAYTEFEHIYAQSKNINSGSLTIKPSGAYISQSFHSSIPNHISKQTTFFLPPYHNETIFMNLFEFCTTLGIKSYCGRYNGPDDLRDFKGVIHIPYAWSNFALFENMHLGISYFIPSETFMRTLISKGAHFQDRQFVTQSLNVCEWYSDKYSPFIVYFDSWKDLRRKMRAYDSIKNKQRIFDLAKKHEEETFALWRNVFTNLTQF
jgi:hypothetical protein